MHVVHVFWILCQLSLDFPSSTSAASEPVISAGLSGFVERRLPWRTFSLTSLNPSIVCDLDRPADWRVERPQIWACHQAQRSASFFGPTYSLTTSRALCSPSPEKERIGNWQNPQHSVSRCSFESSDHDRCQVPPHWATDAVQQQQQQEFPDQKKARTVFGFCSRIRASLSASSRPPLDRL